MTKRLMQSTVAGSRDIAQSQTRLSAKGFTIVELLIVIVVVAILASIAVVAISGTQKRAEESTAAYDARSAGQQLDVEKVNSGRYPASSGDLQTSGGSSIQYDATADGRSYCLTVTRGSLAYRQTPGAAPVSGVCDGHRAPGSPAPIVATCPSGFIPVPGNSKFGTNNFCVMKYEAKNVSSVAVSQPEGLPWTAKKTDASQFAQGACAGCRLMSLSEWLTIGHNALSVGSNWSGGSVGSGSIFTGFASNSSDDSTATFLAASHNDSDGYFGTGESSPSVKRRTLQLSNGEIIWDIAGNSAETVSDAVTQDLMDVSNEGIPSDQSNPGKGWDTLVLPSSLAHLDPAYGTPAAGNWSSAHGLGGLGSNSTAGSTEQLSAFNLLVGGAANLAGSAGLLSVFISRNEDEESAAAFRATV